MNETLAAARSMRTTLREHHWLINKRLALPVFLVVLLIVPATQTLTVQVLADAYFQVGVFVYVSLALYYLATKKITPELISQFVERHPVYEVGLAAILGALPGCGGAIIVVTQYTRGVASFGAIVAVLTSTMGDAAFLLLAQAPADGAIVMLIGMVVGTVTGLIVNRLHNYQANCSGETMPDAVCSLSSQRVHEKMAFWSTRFWLILALPSTIIALLLSMQLDLETQFVLPANLISYVGACLGFIAVLFWACSRCGADYSSLASEDVPDMPPIWKRKAALDTQFVLAWVVTAFLLFELAFVWFGVDMEAFFTAMGPAVVGMAILIGFLPGCGPQILVTSLYLAGAVPFSAQIGNAISNDGDALFPAIAMSPKAALLATIYSAIPAFIVGYGYYFIVEL